MDHGIDIHEHSEDEEERKSEEVEERERERSPDPERTRRDTAASDELRDRVEREGGLGVARASLPGPGSVMAPATGLSERASLALTWGRQRISEARDNVGVFVKNYLIPFGQVLTGINAAVVLYHTLKAAEARAAAAVVAQTADDEVDLVGRLQTQFRNMEEAEYWGAFADFAGQNAPRPISEQLAFMLFTRDLSKALQPQSWTWSDGTQFSQLVEAASARIDQLGLPAALKAVPEMRVDGAPLPRFAAAEVMTLAICDWYRVYS